jgi:alcohol dehydrogenase class IV
MALVDTVFTHAMPTLIKFGRDAIREIRYDIKRLGGSKVMVVTDSVIEKAGILDSVMTILDGEGLRADSWAQVEPEPSIGNYEDCYSFAAGKEVNLVVGVGGGSSIDVGKTLRMMLKYGGEVTDYIDPPIGVGKQFPGPGLPYIAVPTTAGTGSEISPASVIKVPKEKLRVGIRNHFLRPDVALVDPLLTVTLPPRLTASTGVDALSHAIEAYTARRYNCRPKPKIPEERSVYVGSTPITDVFAITAIKLIGKYLLRAFNNGYDLEARESMSLASLMAGVAMSNASVALTHALASPVGGMLRVAHGETISALLPYVMLFNASATPERYIQIARSLGERERSTLTPETAAKNVWNLVKRLGLPSNLAELGINNTALERLAEATVKKKEGGFILSNPRRVSAKDIEQVLHNALKGHI